MSELKEIQIAALLHDIGKFAYRAGVSGSHEELSADFCRRYLPEKLQEGVIGLVAGHGDPSKYLSQGYYPLKIVVLADWLSAGECEEREGEKGEPREEPLISIFSKINIKNNIGNSKSIEMYHHPRILSLDKENVFPKEAIDKKALTNEYENIWKNFIKEVKEIKKLSNFDSYFNTLYYLLKKYTWAIPSAAYVDIPDVSLFDHLRTTCAIAACLNSMDDKNIDDLINAMRRRWEIKELLKKQGLKGEELINKVDEEFNKKATSYEKEALLSENFLIINGDIAGIQRFIYKIASPEEAQKGMSKRLRGRSFYINLINDAIATFIIKNLNLTPANILFSGGGHFVIVAPNTHSAKNEIEKIADRVNKSFLERYNAELYLVISIKDCSWKKLRDFGKIIGEEIGFENLKKKKQKFGSMLESVFIDEEKLPLFLCPVCNSEREENEDICSTCKKHEELGRKIANMTYIAKALSDNRDVFDVYEFGVGYKFYKTQSKVIEDIKDLQGKFESVAILKINNTHFLENSLLDLSNNFQNISLGFSFVGNVAPFHSEKGVLYFDHIADISMGSNKLGILKMDVDDLGKIFSKGLGNNATISRVSTLSSFLDLFFLGYINEIAKNYYVLREVCENCKDKVDPISLNFKEDEKEEITVTVYKEKLYSKVCENCLKTKIPTIYIIYSGGDDLLIVGPYDDTIKFSKELREEFKEWVAKNRDINLSGGIAVVGAKFPIGRSANIANSMLDISKDKEKNLKLSMSNQDTGKDRITVFNETVKWESSDSVPGFNDLFSFAMELENLVENNKVSKGFVYSLLNMWDDTFKNEELLPDKVKKEKKKYVPLLKYKLARAVKDDKDKIRDDLNTKLIVNPCYMPWIKIPASWVSLRTRTR